MDGSSDLEINGGDTAQTVVPIESFTLRGLAGVPAASERFCHLVTPRTHVAEGLCSAPKLSSRGRRWVAGYTVVSFFQGPVRILRVLSAP